eukprot:gene5694-2030_t
MRALLCLLLPLASAMPRFSWDTIQTFTHCANISGPLSPAALRAFRNNSFVVIEKMQCLFCAPVNHSAEAKMYAASRQLKGSNPWVETYVYAAVDVARTMYDAYTWFHDNPAAELHTDSGKLVTHTTTFCNDCPAFDYTDTSGPTPARWNKVIIDAVDVGGMDGAFIDGIASEGGFRKSLLKGIAPARQVAYLVALNATLASLRRQLGGDRVLMQNCHAGWSSSGDARTQLGVGGRIDSKLSFRTHSLLADMALFATTAPRVAALYQNYGPHDTGHQPYNVSL